jgi:hypothetical protein
MSALTAQEYKDLRSGTRTEEQIKQNRIEVTEAEFKENISTKQFLLNRHNETVLVPIEGQDQTMNIEIRAHLSKAELKKHKQFMESWNIALTKDPEILESEEAEQYIAEFLSDLCIDPDLDKEFWLSENLDPLIAQTVLMQYFTSAINQLGDIGKFRKK